MMRKNFNILSKGPSSEGYIVCTVAGADWPVRNSPGQL